MTWCKKCHDKYYTNGGIEYGAVRLCDHCHKLWEKFYHEYKMIRFPDGMPMWWCNWGEQKDRDELFNEWIKPKKVGCYWCKFRKGMYCSGYSKNHIIYNHKVCGLEHVKKEKDLIRILNIKSPQDYEQYGKSYGYLCQFFKSNQFVFR